MERREGEREQRDLVYLLLAMSECENEVWVWEKREEAVERKGVCGYVGGKDI